MEPLDDLPVPAIKQGHGPVLTRRDQLQIRLNFEQDILLFNQVGSKISMIRVSKLLNPNEVEGFWGSNSQSSLKISYSRPLLLKLFSFGLVSATEMKNAEDSTRPYFLNVLNTFSVSL